MDPGLEFFAFRVRDHGGDTVGGVESVRIDALSPGEVVIRVAWSSVNYKDALAATGRGRLIRHFPMIPGIDLAGIVVASSDARWEVGQRVLVTGYDLGTQHTGGYAEYARVPAHWPVAVPAALSLREAMVLGTAGFTTALCIARLEDNHQHPGMGPLLVSGASGGVGGFCIEALSRLGFEVIALTSKPDAVAFLRDLGAHEVWLTGGMSFSTAPLASAQLGGGIDNLGGEVLAWMLKATRPWGNVVSVGLAASADLSTSVMPFILRGVSLLGVSSSNCPPDRRPGLWQRLCADLLPASLARERVREISLENLPSAFQALLNGTHSGRYLVAVGDRTWRENQAESRLS